MGGSDCGACTPESSHTLQLSLKFVISPFSLPPSRVVNGDANSEDLYGGSCERFCAGSEEKKRSESIGIDGAG